MSSFIGQFAFSRNSTNLICSLPFSCALRSFPHLRYPKRITSQLATVTVSTVFPFFKKFIFILNKSGSIALLLRQRTSSCYREQDPFTCSGEFLETPSNARGRLQFECTRCATRKLSAKRAK